VENDVSHAFSLQPIRTKRLSEIAVDQITGLIEGGQIPVGQKLPSERELMSQLGVSRAAVREALRVLEAQGLIEVQPGRGTHVINTTSQADIVSGIVAWLNSHGQEFLEVNAVIELLEGHAAELAAQNASEEDVRQLGELVGEAEILAERGMLHQLIKADRRFHQKVNSLSDNSFLTAMVDAVLTATVGARFSTLRLPGRASASLEEHRSIIKAIASGDPESARNAATRHTTRIRELATTLLQGRQAD